MVAITTIHTTVAEAEQSVTSVIKIRISLLAQVLPTIRSKNKNTVRNHAVQNLHDAVRFGGRGSHRRRCCLNYSK